MFRQNVGGIGRVLRVTLGTVLLLTGLLLLAKKNGIGAIIAVVGLIALATGIVRFWGLYIPFGYSTARPERCGAGQNEADRTAVATSDKR
jgi:hypothetical protein